MSAPSPSMVCVCACVCKEFVSGVVIPVMDHKNVNTSTHTPYDYTVDCWPGYLALSQYIVFVCLLKSKQSVHKAPKLQ